LLKSDHWSQLYGSGATSGLPAGIEAGNAPLFAFCCQAISLRSVARRHLYGAFYNSLLTLFITHVVTHCHLAQSNITCTRMYSQRMCFWQVGTTTFHGLPLVVFRRLWLPCPSEMIFQLEGFSPPPRPLAELQHHCVLRPNVAFRIGPHPFQCTVKRHSKFPLLPKGAVDHTRGAGQGVGDSQAGELREIRPSRKHPLADVLGLVVLVHAIEDPGLFFALQHFQLRDRVVRQAIRPPFSYSD